VTVRRRWFAALLDCRIVILRRTQPQSVEDLFRADEIEDDAPDPEGIDEGVGRGFVKERASADGNERE
jgi:hypothetical protein